MPSTEVGAGGPGLGVMHWVGGAWGLWGQVVVHPPLDVTGLEAGWRFGPETQGWKSEVPVGLRERGTGPPPAYCSLQR